MNLFLQEYYDNSFKKNRIHSDEQKREIGQVNNERRRDLYAVKGSVGLVSSLESLTERAS